MLSMSAINIQTSSTPVVPVSRPALVTEVVRSASPLAEIQPATGVSRERSRVEAKPQNPATNGEVAQQRQAESAVAVQELMAARRQAERAAQNGQPASGEGATDRPPSEKSPIQKALDTQVREVLSNVWKASGKAVDFLLGRRESLMDRTLNEVLLPGEVDYLGAKLEQSASTEASAAAGDIVAYTAQGGSDGSGDPRGKLLDLVA